MRLRTFREFEPVCIVTRAEAQRLGLDTTLFSTFTREEAFEMWYRLRSFRLTGTLEMFTQQGPRTLTFSTPAMYMHVYAPPWGGASEEIPDEAHFPCLGHAPYDWRTWTPEHETSYPKVGTSEGAATVTASASMFTTNYIVKEEDGRLSFWFLVSVVAIIEDVPVSDGMSGAGGEARISFTPGDVVGSWPTLSTPWGTFGSGVSFIPDMGMIDISGSVTLEPLSWWPYAKEDGTEPWWDAATGAPLAPNPLVVGWDDEEGGEGEV